MIYRVEDTAPEIAEETPPPAPRRSILKSPVVLVLLVALLVGGGIRVYHEFTTPDFGNYKVNYPPPAPWKAIPHSPGALWLYQNPKTKTLVRGATTQMVFDFNVQPSDTSEKIAADMVDATRQHLKMWTAKRLKNVPGGSVEFAMVRRDKKDQTVITAVLCKGNTTLIVALDAHDEAAKHIEDEIPYFYGMLKKITLTPTVIQ